MTELQQTTFTVDDSSSRSDKKEMTSAAHSPIYGGILLFIHKWQKPYDVYDTSYAESNNDRSLDYNEDI